MSGNRPKVQHPSVAVILTTFDGVKYLDGLWSSLQTRRYPRERWRLIVVDNGPEPGVAGWSSEGAPAARAVVTRGHQGAHAGSASGRRALPRQRAARGGTLRSGDVHVPRGLRPRLAAAAGRLAGAAGAGRRDASRLRLPPPGLEAEVLLRRAQPLAESPDALPRGHAAAAGARAAGLRADRHSLRRHPRLDGRAAGRLRILRAALDVALRGGQAPQRAGAAAPPRARARAVLRLEVHLRPASQPARPLRPRSPLQRLLERGQAPHRLVTTSAIRRRCSASSAAALIAGS